VFSALRPTDVEHQVPAAADYRLWVLCLLSLLVHVLAVPALMQITSSSNKPNPTPALLESLPPDKPKVRAGIEESSHNTLTWLGFADPEPHEARLDEMDQASLSPQPTPGPPEPSSVPVQGEAQPQSQPQTRTTSQPEPQPESQPQPEPTPQPEPQPVQPTQPNPLDTMIERGEVLVRNLAEQGMVVAGQALQGLESIVPPAQPQPKPQPKPQPEPQPEQEAETEPKEQSEQPEEETPTPPQPRPQGVETDLDGEDDRPVGGGESRLAEESEKESSATSTIVPVRVRPGRPAAAQGLDITTVRPRWPYVTRLSAYPRDPVLWVRFNSKGLVSDAGFVDGRSTGDARVDGPLLDAIFLWTAKGKVIDALGPTETHLMRFAIDLGVR
jgi:outer membrane biosynthesis protein TonB